MTTRICNHNPRRLVFALGCVLTCLALVFLKGESIYFRSNNQDLVSTETKHPVESAPPIETRTSHGSPSNRSTSMPSAPSAYRKCIREVSSNRIPNLIAKLVQDPETNAMRPLTIHRENDDEDYVVQGLNLNTFRGKKIALMGDSTLFYLTKSLYTMLAPDKNGDPKFDEMTFTQAQRFVKSKAPHVGVELECCQQPKPLKLSDGTWIEWMGMSGPAQGETEKRLGEMFSTAEKMKPDIMVANMAMHWLHLCGFEHCPTDGIVIKRWLNYESDWLQHVYDLAIKVKAKLLLFKTPNFICDSNRYGDWAKYSKLYLSYDNQTIENCIRLIEPLVVDSIHRFGMKITSKHLDDYCRYGQFTENGGRYLNDQIFNFVHSIHGNQELQSPGNNPNQLSVGIFNDHDVENCKSTKDGIHHLFNMLLRIRLLANTIEGYVECASSFVKHKQ